MSSCWRFSGTLYLENGTGAKTQVFTCGLTANLAAARNGQPYNNAFVDGVQIDIGGVKLDPNDDYPFPLHLVTGSESLVAVASDQETLPGINIAGSCNGCQIKYDCLNGSCVSQADYGTPGLYHSLAACQAACGDGEVQFSIISAIIFKECDAKTGAPVFDHQDLQVIKGTEGLEEFRFEQMANIQAELLCNINVVAAVPDSWLIRPEHDRPQVVYQFAEVNPNTGVLLGSPMFVITVPHHKLAKPSDPLPNYQRGNWETIYVLNDNSKVKLHTIDQATGNMMLDAITARIDPAMMTKAYLSKSSELVLVNPIAPRFVKNRMAKLFSIGARNVLPDWIIKW